MPRNYNNYRLNIPYEVTPKEAEKVREKLSEDYLVLRSMDLEEDEHPVDTVVIMVIPAKRRRIKGNK